MRHRAQSQAQLRTGHAVFSSLRPRHLHSGARQKSITVWGAGGRMLCPGKVKGAGGHGWVGCCRGAGMTPGPADSSPLRYRHSEGFSQGCLLLGVRLTASPACFLTCSQSLSLFLSLSPTALFLLPSLGACYSFRSRAAAVPPLCAQAGRGQRRQVSWGRGVIGLFSLG